MINFLLQDFPFFVAYKKVLRVSLILCSLSFLFSLITSSLFAQPEQNPSSLAFIILFMVFGSQLVFRIIIPKIFKGQFSKRNWTVGKEIIWLLLEIVTGIIFCYILLLWIWDIPEGPYLENSMKGAIILFVGLQLFTIPLSVYLKREIVLQDYLKKATFLNMLLIKKGLNRLPKYKKGLKVKLESKDDNTNVELFVSDILFLKGAQNYIEVFYVVDGTAKRILLRNTLKAVFRDLAQFKIFIFCHRSHIINIRRVITVSGNSRGYKVLLENYGEFIPVSRQKSLEFEVAIDKMKNQQPRGN